MYQIVGVFVRRGCEQNGSIAINPMTRRLKVIAGMEQSFKDRVRV